MERGLFASSVGHCLLACLLLLLLLPPNFEHGPCSIITKLHRLQETRRSEWKDDRALRHIRSTQRRLPAKLLYTTCRCAQGHSESRAMLAPRFLRLGGRSALLVTKLWSYCDATPCHAMHCTILRQPACDRGNLS